MQFQLDPHPAYQTLRDFDPVHRHTDPPFWALSRFDDVWDAVRDPAIWSSARGLTFHPDEMRTLELPPTVVMLDPPRHTQLRALISKAMAARRVTHLEDLVRNYVRERIDVLERKAADGQPVDLHRDFSSPIPTFVIAHILGVPERERTRFDAWVAALVVLQDTGFRPSEDAANGALAEMFAYFSDVLVARRRDPGDDLISALAVAEVDGQRLTDWDILGFCFVLVLGGNDSAGNLISHGVQLLDGDHSQRELLREHAELIPGAVLEFLRLESSVQGLARTTTRAVTLHGTRIPEGERVMMLYASANRDEREFGPSADQLDVTRQIRRHLSFSSGPHFCVGSHLARLEARVALEELLARQPHIGVDLDRAERLPSPFLRGWVTLPATGVRPAC